MNAKMIFHGFTLSLETAALVVFVMWNYFSTTTATERDFARDGDRLCVTFARDQVQYLKAFQNIRIYYTDGRDPKFVDYCRRRDDSILSEGHAFDISVDSTSPSEVYDVEVPAGFFDFRMDFQRVNPRMPICRIPEIERVSIGKRDVDVERLKPYLWHFENGNYAGYRYKFNPFFEVHIVESLLISICIWMIAMIVIYFVLRKPQGIPMAE